MPPWEKARFGDVIGSALRGDALTIARPGMINDMKLADVDWDAKTQDHTGGEDENWMGPSSAAVAPSPRNPAARVTDQR